LRIICEAEDQKQSIRCFPRNSSALLTEI